MIIREPNRYKDHSVLLRIMTNYLSEIMMVMSLKLNWPEKLIEFFKKVSFLNDANKSILKIYCFM